MLAIQAHNEGLIQIVSNLEQAKKDGDVLTVVVPHELGTACGAGKRLGDLAHDELLALAEQMQGAAKANEELARLFTAYAYTLAGSADLNAETATSPSRDVAP
jgi:hypothetical protein